MNQTPQTLVLSDNKISVKIDFVQTKKSIAILKALNHKLRLQMLKLIDESQKITVTEIYVKLRIEQSVASQHLAMLRRANIVTTKREGKFIYYFINYNRVEEITNFVKDLVA